MADTRRIVSMSAGGRPVLELDLETAPSYQAIMDTFAYVPGARNQQASREPGRYGGQQVVGESNDNGTVGWQALVFGATPAVCASNIEALLLACERTGRGRLLEWRPDGAAFSSYFRIAGPATWKPTISWKVWQGTGAMVVEVSFPVRPLVLWDPMTITDDFAVDSLSDYTFDAATSADVAVSGGTLAPVVGATLATERRARHTVRGYPLLEGQATVKATPGSTLSGFKAGVVLRGSAPTTYVEVYVDDNGTNSRLRVDVVIAGTRTNRATVNLAARISNGTAFWVRGRIVGGVVFAEHFTSTPTPTGTPTTQSPSGGAGYTLVAGDASLNTTAGHAGWSWVPQQTAARLDDFEARPYVRRNQSPPVVTHWADAVPGTAPALMDVMVGIPASQSIISAMIAWAPSAAGTIGAVAVLDSSASSVSALTETAAAGAYGGSDARATMSGATTFAGRYLQWNLSNEDLPPDDFASDTIELEVWARILLTDTVVNPMARASFATGTGGGTLYSVEFGSAGRPLSISPATGANYLVARLGVIPVDAAFSSGSLTVALACAAGSTGAFGIDYAVVVPARRRAASPTAVADGSDVYPRFAPFETVEQVKTVRSDLSGRRALLPSEAGSHHGLGGALIQPPAGPLDTLLSTWLMVPDAAPPLSITDSLSPAVTTMLDVVPRSYLLRSA